MALSTGTDPKIFHILDVVESYDKGFASDGWVTLLNDNFAILEALIFGGTGGGLTITSAGFTLGRLSATIAASAITVDSGVVVTLHNSDLELYKFVCTTTDLTASLGSPTGSIVGVGGIDNTNFGSFASDIWVYYYIIGGGTGASVPEGLVISSNPTAPSLGAGFDADYSFFRRLGSARYDQGTDSLLLATNVEGETIYRNQQTVTSANSHGATFVSVAASGFIPPTTTRGVFSAYAADSANSGEAFYFIGHTDDVGIGTGGKQIANRGAADTGGSAEYMVNEFNYDTDTAQNIALRNVSFSTVFNLFSTGYKETL